MLRIKKILLPTDFSKPGVAAAKQAGALARHFKAELTLLHVNPVFVPGQGLPHELPGPIDTGWVTALEAQRYRELVSYHQEEFHDIDLNCVVVTGDPATRIVEHAHKDQTDLIVMPTRGSGRFRRFLIGSVTAKVLHDANCPVWTGAHLEDGAPPQLTTMGNVLCAIDNGAASERVLNWASSLAAEFHAPLTTVHAMPKFVSTEGPSDPELRNRRVAAAESTVRCLQTKTRSRGDIVVSEGDPVKVVAVTAVRSNADVVVIGRTPAEGNCLQAHAYGIIRESPCPVVSV